MVHIDDKLRRSIVEHSIEDATSGWLAPAHEGRRDGGTMEDIVRQSFDDAISSQPPAPENRRPEDGTISRDAIRRSIVQRSVDDAFSGGRPPASISRRDTRPADDRLQDMWPRSHIAALMRGLRGKDY